MAMEVLKELYVLIDYVGHPSMNDDYLNKKRLDTLNLLLRTKTSKTIISIGSEFGNRKQNWKYFTRYHEMFEEIKSFAYRRSNIIWIDLIDDPSFQVLTDELSNKNYTIVPSITKINIGGTNLSGCILYNKKCSVTQFTRLGFKVNVILPMCAEGENTGINDFEKMMKAVTIVYEYLKTNKLTDNVDLIWNTRWTKV
tara:strand:+ start:33 stop:623 length:591 start_codon:yes stop_codon:yes gene_type:complete